MNHIGNLSQKNEIILMKLKLLENSFTINQKTDQVAGGDKVHVRCKIDLSMGPTSHAHTVPHERRIRH